jgi:hypothetical protein
MLSQWKAKQSVVRTPDRFPGEREDEGLLLEPSAVVPTVNGEARYVIGVGFRFFEEGIEKGLTAGGVFGNSWQYGANEGVSSTTSNSYQQKLRLTTPSISAGDYLIWWHALITTTLANKNFQARVQVDDTTTLSEVQYRNAIADHDYIFTGFQRVTLTAASHDIDIDWSSSVSSETSIERARLAIWRVS